MRAAALRANSFLEEESYIHVVWEFNASKIDYFPRICTIKITHMRKCIMAATPMTLAQ